MRNTENVKIKITENKTSLTFNQAEGDDEATYTCKATSDLGEAKTVAKLYVQEVDHGEKDKLREEKAKEEKERLKAERLKKRAELARRVSVATEQIVYQEPITEVVSVEFVKSEARLKREAARAERVLALAEAVRIEEIAALKKIDKDAAEQEEAEQRASELRAAAELKRALIEEIDVCEVIKKISTLRKTLDKEIEEVIKFTQVQAFGPGEQPIKELAEIGFLVRHGITVNEVMCLYDCDKFPALRQPEAQSAMVNLVERQGWGTLISDVLIEESTLDEDVAATVGFRAFMRMIELEHATVEEVITQFSPEDFVSHPWELKEAKEVSDILNQ